VHTHGYTRTQPANGDPACVAPRVQAAVEGPLELRNVHFSYPVRPEVAVLCGLDLVLPRGQVQAGMWLYYREGISSAAATCRVRHSLLFTLTVSVAVLHVHHPVPCPSFLVSPNLSTHVGMHGPSHHHIECRSQRWWAARVRGRQP
jgi:hypothetical protein